MSDEKLSLPMRLNASTMAWLLFAMHAMALLLCFLAPLSIVFAALFANRDLVLLAAVVNASAYFSCSRIAAMMSGAAARAGANPLGLLSAIMLRTRRRER